MKKYIVALETGGLQEDPNIRYSDYEIIEAQSAEEAENNYNAKHNCNFFYGCVVGEIVENIVVLSDLYKTKVISENIDAKLYAKIEEDYSSSENYQSWFTDLIIECDENDKTVEYLANGYILVGNYDSKEEKLKVDIKNITIIDCIANYVNKSKTKRKI